MITISNRSKATHDWRVSMACLRSRWTGFEDARRTARKVGWIQVSGPVEDVAEAKRRLDVIADDYLPMSEIIAQRIPSMLQAAPEQTTRVRARVRSNLQTLHAMLKTDRMVWSACCGRKAAGMCFCACQACLTKTSWCLP